MTALEAIQRAYDITDRMTVSGGAIEQMATLRAALREAYAACRKEQSEGDDGK